MRNKLFRRADILLAFACLFLAAVFFLWSFLSPSGGIAVIEQNGIEVGRYVLSQIQKKEILQLPGEMNVQILLEPGAVSFLSSDCPDQNLCAHRETHKTGRSRRMPASQGLSPHCFFPERDKRIRRYHRLRRQDETFQIYRNQPD